MTTRAYYVGDRVRYMKAPATIATVRAVGTHYLAVQVDGRPYEDAWPVEAVERIQGDDQ